MELFKQSQLRSMQAAGTQVVTDSELLGSKYGDRWQVADQLMNQVNEEFHHKFNSFDPTNPLHKEKWEDENIPEKSYANKFVGPMFGCDLDYMIGPHDWDDGGENFKPIGDYVMRKKLYIYPWSRREYDNQEHRSPELEYFMDLHADFMPVLEHYRDECFSDQNDNISKDLYKMMVVQYATPTATDLTRVSHRAWCTERFGPAHCDETLGGLHLGENYQEFQAQNSLTDEWEFVPELDGSSRVVWLLSEFAEKSGWKPTEHRMIHNPDPSLDMRYMIGFDLQARYKGEE